MDAHFSDLTEMLGEQEERQRQALDALNQKPMATPMTTSREEAKAVCK